MEIAFKTSKLKKQLTNSKQLLKAFGNMARKINQRVSDLEAAQSLQDMAYLPGAHCHELSGARKGQLSLKINANYRMIIKPDHNPVPCKDEGGLDWAKVNKIVILQIEDYH